MLHTLRQIVNNDEKWRSILRGLNLVFYHQTVTTEQIENYLSKHTGIKLKPFFDQYLRTIQIPKFEYQIKGNQFLYRWSNVVDGFNMPIKVTINDQIQWFSPTEAWKKLQIESNNIIVKTDNNFYIDVEDFTNNN